MISLTYDQQIALGLMKEFVHDEVDRVFMLKGYAGSGKTSLIVELIQYLKGKNIPYQLLASTGRAAKMLSLKTGSSAQTVHSFIYTFTYNVLNSQSKTAKVTFSIRDNPTSLNTLFIVDEASLISDHKSVAQSLEFGTGKLLSDFFKFLGHRKAIFVGDPAQLPPINTLFSPALNASYVEKEFRKPVKEAFLYEVIRYAKNSGIYFNAEHIRKQLENPKSVRYMTLFAKNFTDIEVVEFDSILVKQYVDGIRQNGIASSIMICYTNASCNILNQLARQQLFPDRTEMGEGDLVIVGSNNYLYKLDNGQQLYIRNVSDKVERRANLHFRNIEFSLVNPDGISTITLHAKIIDEYLYRPKPIISADEEFELVRDFFIRTDKEIKKDTIQLVEKLGTDPYLNALRIRFGYAITCHKAQGGEWENVYLILEKLLFAQTKDDKEFLLRWTYTALTRAQKRITFLNNICIKR